MGSDELSKFKVAFDRVMEELEAEGFFDRFERKAFPERFDSKGNRITVASDHLGRTTRIW